MLRMLSQYYAVLTRKTDSAAGILSGRSSLCIDVQVSYSQITAMQVSDC